MGLSPGPVLFPGSGAQCTLGGMSATQPVCEGLVPRATEFVAELA